MRQKVVLKGRRAVIMSSVMNAIIPTGGPFKAGASDYDLIPRANEVLRSYNPAIARAFPLILLYVQISSFPRTGRIFTSLGPERGARFLEGMEHSPFYYRRMTALILKLITCLVFYEIDEAARQIGYNHGCHLRPASPVIADSSGKQKGRKRL